MEVGIDTFAAAFAADPDDTRRESDEQRLQNVLQEIEFADRLGLHKCEKHMQFLKEWEATPVSYGNIDSEPSQLAEPRVAFGQTSPEQ